MVIELCGFSFEAGVDSKSRLPAIGFAFRRVSDSPEFRCPHSGLWKSETGTWKRAGKGKVHVVMSGDIFHVAALGKEIIDITKIGISDNF
jgi:hypothetical protein